MELLRVTKGFSGAFLMICDTKCDTDFKKPLFMLCVGISPISRTEQDLEEIQGSFFVYGPALCGRTLNP